MRAPERFASILRRALVLAAVALAVPAVQAQVCQGFYALNTQAEVDAFDYVEVTGAIRIDGGSITNLNGLSELTAIGEGLTISFTGLPNLTGLENLTSIGNVLSFYSNSSLVNFAVTSPRRTSPF